MVTKKNSKFKIQNLKIRRDDVVKIILGKDRGKTGKVMAVLPRQRRVLVESVNMVKKHVRPRRAGEKGSRVSVAAPVHISNVQVVCGACKKSSRLGIKREAGQRRRVCKKCQAMID